MPQKPDIVLRLSKTEREHHLKLTYLFDAKYRIDGKDNRAVDVPPEDAINQMHRYRDAIYYTEHDGTGLKKEVVGGYILFPGNGEPADVQVARFYESIKEVNIGAFPLRPKNEENRKLLDDFVKQLLTSRANTVLTQRNVIPQKGLRYERDESAFGCDPICLVCYTSVEWIEKVKAALLYCVRTGKRKGKIKFDADAAAISKVVLLPLKKDEDAYIFDLREDGADIFRGEELAKKGFVIKEENLQEPYLVYVLSEMYHRLKFENLNTNPHIPSNAHISQAPFIIRMSQLE